MTHLPSATMSSRAPSSSITRSVTVCESGMWEGGGWDWVRSCLQLHDRADGGGIGVMTHHGTAPGAQDKAPPVMSDRSQPAAATSCAAQLLLMKKGSSQHVYPKVVDLTAAFAKCQRDTLVIGRGKESDILLPMGEVPTHGQHPPALHSISRKHCLLQRHAVENATGPHKYRYTIRDNKSLNGTFINWRKVDTNAVEFSNQDMLCFGGGGRLQVGEKLSEQPVADQHPIAYLLYIGASGRRTEGAKVHVDAAPDDVAEYSQVSCRSLDGQMELMRLEQEQEQQQQQQQQPSLSPPPPLPERDAPAVTAPVVTAPAFAPGPVAAGSVLAPPTVGSAPAATGTQLTNDSEAFSEDLIAITPAATGSANLAAATPSAAARRGLPPSHPQTPFQDDAPATVHTVDPTAETPGPLDAGDPSASVVVVDSQAAVPAPAATSPNTRRVVVEKAAPPPAAAGLTFVAKRRSSSPQKGLSAAGQPAKRVKTTSGAAAPFVPPPHVVRRLSPQKKPAAAAVIKTAAVTRGGATSGKLGGGRKDANRPPTTPTKKTRTLLKRTAPGDEDEYGFGGGGGANELVLEGADAAGTTAAAPGDDEKMEEAQEEDAGAAVEGDAYADDGAVDSPPPVDRFDFDLAPEPSQEEVHSKPAATPKKNDPGGVAGDSVAPPTTPQMDAVVVEPPTVLSQHTRGAAATAGTDAPDFGKATTAAAAVVKSALKKGGPTAALLSSAPGVVKPKAPHAPAAPKVGAKRAAPDAPQNERAGKRAKMNSEGAASGAKRPPLKTRRVKAVAAGGSAAGLPKIRTGFDLLCADKREEAKQKDREVTRPQLIAAWRNLDVARKDAYERRAAAEKAGLIAKHPELALLNPNQEDEEARLLAQNGGKVRASRDKAAKMEGRAIMRAARAKLFEELEKKTDETSDLLSAIEQQVPAPAGGGDPTDSTTGDLFQLDESMLGSYVRNAKPTGETMAAVSERVLGKRGDYTLILPKNLADLLKRHQVRGVQFLWKNLVALPELLAKEGAADGGAAASSSSAHGCIIAHGMGLGKTLTSIAFLLMWLRMGKGNRILVVAPKSTLKQWARELAEWSDAAAHECPPTYIVESVKQAAVVKTWDQDGGVLVVSYAMFVRLVGIGGAAAGGGSPSPRAKQPRRSVKGDATGSGEKFPTAGAPATAEEKEDEKNAKEIMRASQFVDDDDEAEQAEVERAAKEAQKQQAKPQNTELTTLLEEVATIVKERTSVVVVDEGHKIASPSAALTRSLNCLTTLDRVVLTGTPLQNNMKQYHTMIDFVRPGSWGIDDLNDIYVRAASDPSARTELAHVMNGFIQRFDCRVLRDELPPLTEYIIYTTLSPLQRRVYSELMTSQGGDQSSKVKTSKALSLSALMFKLCAHTHLLREYCYGKGVKPLEELQRQRDTADGNFDVDDDLVDRMLKGTALYSDTGRDFTWALPLFQNDTYIGGGGDDTEALEHNPKTRILMDIIDKAAGAGEKVVVFCESAGMMDVIEACLKKRDGPPNARRYTSVMGRSTAGGAGGGGVFPFATNKRRSVGQVKPQWRRGAEYHRLDGSVGLNKRQAICDDFNNAGSRSQVLLISTRAGGLGINLIGATRVVLYGVSWNPQSELQAIYRSYRYGQTKPVTVYRLVSQGTVEQTVFARNAAKMQMAMQVLEDRWTRTDLKSFDVIPPTDWGFHAKKDAVLQVLHAKHREAIHSVLLHDSLKLPLDAVEEQDADGEGSSDSEDSVVQILLDDDDVESSRPNSSDQQPQPQPQGGRGRSAAAPQAAAAPAVEESQNAPGSQDVAFVFSDVDDDSATE